MRFSLALPLWALVLLALAVVATAWFAYRRPAVPLSHPRRLTLTALRALALLLVVGCILRPVRLLPPDTPIAEVVPILVDTSRSMRLPDGRGQRRIDAARTLVQQQLEPALAARFHTELWAFGDGVTRADAQALGAEGGRSDLSGALSAITERYRGRRVPAVIVVSDGGDTGHADAAAAQDVASHPVFTVGIGEPREGLDLEVSDVSAGDATLAESSIDLTVTAVSRASRSPFDLRVLENGRPIDVRRVTPTAAGSPVHTVFTVSPPASAATLYTIEIPAASGEDVLENNRRSVLVEPPGRRRRILMVEGAPGFEHTFLKRALDADTGLEVDSIVRKGRDAQGQATYLVQSSDERAPQLAAGFPADRSALFQYDALVLANVENDALTRAQLDMAAAFVGERGGGAVVLGAKSFAQRGLVGTVLEQVLPLSLADRGNGIVPASSRGDRYKVNVTNDGEVHPVMRIGSTSADTVQRWSGVPALSGAAALGALRPGAQVLAVVQTPDGARPLVTVERYGQGRSMVFAGEATWRWRMQMAASDRTYELFWRQATRWLASGATDPVTIAALPNLSPGDATSIGADIRDPAFMPVSGAQVTMRVSLPGGESRELHPTLTDPRTGRYASDFRFERAGVYRVVVEAKRGATSLGTAERWALVGGADVEMSDPRLNEDVLRRVSHTTGGEYFTVDTASRLAARLTSAGVSPAAPRVQELWQTPWLFAAVIMLLAGEWVLRRQWGLR